MKNPTEIRCSIELRADASRESPGQDRRHTLLTYGESVRSDRARSPLRPGQL